MAWVSSVDSRVRELAGGLSRFEVPAATVRGLIAALEAGFSERRRELSHSEKFSRKVS